MRIAFVMCGLGILLTGRLLAAETDEAKSGEIKTIEPADREAMRAYREKVLTIYDADKSGRLDPDERALLREDIESGKIEAPPVPPEGRGRFHRRGPPREILERYDGDGDGQLNVEERAALRADVESGKIKLPKRILKRRALAEPAEDSQG